MKKIKTLIACFTSMIYLSAISLSVLNVSADAKLLGIDSSENEIYGGVYDELVGFDEDGKPIIIDKTPDDIFETPDDAPIVDILSDEYEKPVTTCKEPYIDLNGYLVFPEAPEPCIAKCLGTDGSGKEIYGGYYDELVGFDEDGNPIIINEKPEGSFKLPLDIISGDVDFNRKIDLADLVGLSLCLLGDSEFTEAQKSAADVNADEEIDITDLAVLKQYIMGDQIELGKK